MSWRLLAPEFTAFASFRGLYARPGQIAVDEVLIRMFAVSPYPINRPRSTQKVDAWGFDRIRFPRGYGKIQHQGNKPMRLITTVPPRYPEGRSLDEDIGFWWVLHTKPNCEKQMAAYLLNREISYYLPLYQKKTRFGNLKRIRTVEAPLFGGYLCFALDKQDHRKLYDTKKFVRIIPIDDQARFVDELQSVARAIETEPDLLVRPGLVPGRRIRVSSGPLEGIEGVIVQRRGDRQLALSVQMFNQTVVVKLDPLTRTEVL
jgi:transcription antitermination factor NusG